MSALAVALVVMVRAYDTFGVADREMAVARRTVADAFQQAGIEVVWRDCPVKQAAGPSAPACDESLDASELIVRIAVGTSQTDERWLGYSYVDVEEKRGTLATIFGDRVWRVAICPEVGAGTLLGRAIAHEIGHLLMGTHEHSRRGLMRADWTIYECAPELKADWVFTRDEGARMRRGLTARTQPPRIPAAVVAGVRR